MLGERLRQARLASGQTLRELAAKTGGVVTAAAISDYEREKHRPRQSVLLALARAMDTSPARLIGGEPVSLAVVEFRKKANLPQAKEEQIKARVSAKLEPYIDLIELSQEGKDDQFYASFARDSVVTSADDVEGYAEWLRDQWRLGQDPIRNVTQMLEERGVLVVEVDADKRFDELACRANGRYSVLVSKQLEPGKGDRQRFNLLHGLGHLMLCPGADIDKEKMCHRFAAAMLAPRAAALKKLGEKRRMLDLDFELPQLKTEFGMSIAAWINRAADLRVIDDATRTHLYAQTRSRGWAVNEPPEIPLEEPSYFKLMVHRAAAEGAISAVRAAELLGDMETKTKAPLEEASVPSSAIRDYQPGGDLDVWGTAAGEDF